MKTNGNVFRAKKKYEIHQICFYVALTGVEEEAVRVTGAEVEREVVAGGDDGPPAHLGEVVGEELAAGEGGLGRVQS